MSSYQIDDYNLASYGDFYHIGDGKYECRDTGFIGTYAQIVGTKSASKAPRPAPASAAKKAAADAARTDVKKMGDYRAMTSGTPKQKAWAETIRRDILVKMPSDVRGHFVHIKSAKFWIDNREEDVDFWMSKAEVPTKKSPKKRVPAVKGVARRSKSIINKHPKLKSNKQRAPQWTQPGFEAQASAFEHLDGQVLEDFLVEMMTVHCFRQGADLHAGRAAIRARFNIADEAML
ncbi:hypothetical protein [Sulfitobacter sp. 1A13679]|uniref:hypothetical protein n=1 Tax=Sulfitobacter sp. 1A13679 TaxID=3368597 RepID=UPI003744B732